MLLLCQTLSGGNNEALKGIRMAEEHNFAEMEKNIENLTEKVKSLEARIAELEAKLETEREDLMKLQEAANQDHQRLESMQVRPPPPPTSVAPVGL